MIAHNFMRALAMALVCNGVVFTAIAAMPAQNAPKTADATPRPPVPDVCLTQIFYEPLPGKANYCLGLHDWSHGHYDDGLELFKLAAGWGNKSAQYTLGLIHYGGHHVPADPALGIAWLRLANERHNDPQIELTARSALKWATPAQRKRANQLFEELSRTYGDKVAASRAWRRLRRWQERHAGDIGNVCLTGQQRDAAIKLGIISNQYQIRETLVATAKAVHKSEAAKVQAGCVGITLHVRRQAVQATSDHYFKGWIGTVTVGPLRQVPASAASTRH